MPPKFFKGLAWAVGISAVFWLGVGVAFAQVGPPPSNVVGRVEILVTNVTAHGLLPNATSVFNALTLFNYGTKDAYCTDGVSATIATTSSKWRVPAGRPLQGLYVPASSTYVACITDGSDTTSITVYQGSGTVIVGTANATNSGGTVTSITAGTGLSGGTITGSGTIALLPSAVAVIGGVNSKAVVSHNFLTGIGTDGSVTQAQPAASDVSGLAAIATSGSATDLAAGTVASARGGAGAITGALKGNGAGVVSQAASTDLSDSALLARLASPALSGLPTAPTAAPGTNTTQIATTAFVAAGLGTGITIGSTPVNGGVSGRILYDNGGTLAENTVTGTGSVVEATGPTIASPTFSGTVAGAGTIPNSVLANSTISGVALGANLGTLTFGTHLTNGGSSYNGSAGVTITSDAASANTASAIVARDGSGNFAAGTITASLTGLASLNLPLTGGTLTGAAVINTNVTAAPSPISGAGLLVNAANGVTARVQSMSYGAIAAFSTARANGTAASPTGLVNADQIGGVNGYGWTSAAALAGPAYSYRGYSTETWGATANGTKACIATTANTTTTLTDKFCVDQDGSATHTSASSSAFAVGLNGATNPAFKVDDSTALQVAGVGVTGAVTGGTVAITAIDSGSNTNLTINAKGSGTIGIGSGSTGAVTITPTLTLGSTLIFGGVVFTNTTGTAGALVSSVSPTITGTGTISAATLSASTQFSGPLYRGGTATSTALVIESTSAAGTTDSITFKTGSQVTALTISTAQLATFTGQVAVTNMTQTSAAQSGTVCWAVGGLTYDATLGCLASLPELKDFHGEITGALATIQKITPMWASWKPGTPEWQGGDHAAQPVFNAREVAAVDDRLTANGPDGKLRGVRYMEMSAYTWAGLKELDAATTARFKALEDEIAGLRSQLYAAWLPAIDNHALSMPVGLTN